MNYRRMIDAVLDQLTTAQLKAVWYYIRGMLRR